MYKPTKVESFNAMTTVDDSHGVNYETPKQKVSFKGVAALRSREPFRLASVRKESFGIPIRLILILGLSYLIVSIVCIACTIRNVKLAKAAVAVDNVELALVAESKWHMYLGSTFCALFYSLAVFTIASLLIKFMPMKKPSSDILAPFKKKLGLSSEAGEDCREFVEACLVSDLEKCGWEGIVWYGWAALLSLLGLYGMFQDSSSLGFLMMLSSGLPVCIGYLFTFCLKLSRQFDFVKRMQDVEAANPSSEGTST